MISVAYTSQYPKFNILKLYLFTFWFYNGGKKLQNNIQGLHERFVQIIWRLIINIFLTDYQNESTVLRLLWFKNCAWSLACQFKIWYAIWYESNWSFKNKNSQKFIIKLANQKRTTADILKGVTESYFKKKKIIWLFF